MKELNFNLLLKLAPRVFRDQESLTFSDAIISFNDCATEKENPLAKCVRDAFEGTRQKGLNISSSDAFQGKDFENSCMVYLQLSSGCAKPSVMIRLGGMFPRDNSNFKSLANFCSTGKTVPVIDFEDSWGEPCRAQLGGKRLYLCAFPNADCFYGWFAHPRVIEHVKETLNNRSLAYVFDLDQTLVQGHTHQSMCKYLEEKKEEKSSEGMGLCKRYLETWRPCLDQYRKGFWIRHSFLGGLRQPETQMVQMSTGRNAERQVIEHKLQNVGSDRDKDRGRIAFTCIEPCDRSTAMVLFIRPGWDRVARFLQRGNGRKNAMVYVSTKGQKEYAWEVWRLLDKKGDLIPRSDFGRKIESGSSQRKSLASAIFGDPNLVNLNERLPFAIAIDDRVDVWKAGEEVYNIRDYTPHFHLKMHKDVLKTPAYVNDPLPSSGDSRALDQFTRIMEVAESTVWSQVKDLEGRAKRLMNENMVAFSDFRDSLPHLPSIMKKTYKEDTEFQEKLGKIMSDLKPALSSLKRLGPKKTAALERIKVFLSSKGCHLGAMEDTKALAEVFEGMLKGI
ncbi:hypothetical protein HOP50_12g65480 [Chloropicon primus]|nr:hypothetical protein HOP50_12g65480 [Chloropicon primus]